MRACSRVLSSKRGLEAGRGAGRLVSREQAADQRAPFWKVRAWPACTGCNAPRTVHILPKPLSGRELRGVVEEAFLGDPLALPTLPRELFHLGHRAVLPLEAKPPAHDDVVAV